MTDIVERLRDAHIRLSNVGVNAERLMHEAADEIERLRAALWHAREDLAHLMQQIDGVLGQRTNEQGEGRGSD